MPDRPLMTRAEVATYLNVPTKTVAQWAYRGEGPQYVRIGRHARYRWPDVEQWLAERRGPEMTA